jgi:hypothetical protein
MIEKLWQHLTKRRRRQFWLLLILMIMASIMEIISIGAVVPFLGALTSPEQIYQHHLAQPLIQILEITDFNQLLLPLTIIFVMAILIAAAVRSSNYNVLIFVTGMHMNSKYGSTVDEIEKSGFKNIYKFINHDAVKMISKFLLDKRKS